MRFQWDVKKAAVNFKKHGISFEVACTVFDDPHHLSVIENSSKEERWVTIGLSGDSKTLVVVHLFFESLGQDEIVRIISARKATKKEKREYEEGI